MARDIAARIEVRTGAHTPRLCALYPAVDRPSAPPAGRTAAELGLQLGDATPRIVQLVFEPEDAADGREGHPLVGEPDDVLDERDLLAGVPALATGRSARADDLVLVEPAEERLLHAQHPRDLADGVERGPAVIDRQ